MEYFDVVNENDGVIGKASRDACHSNPELIHRTCHFTLIDKEVKKVLLTQRSFNKKNDPGKLCFLGEHMLSGETYEEGVKRGIKEELGIEVQSIHERAKKIFYLPDETEFVRFFLAEWTRKILNYDRNEIIGIEWLSLNELIKRKHKYSDMTKYWVENVDWERVFE